MGNFTRLEDHGVVVENANLLHPKMLEIIDILLTNITGGVCLTKILISENGPVNAMGEYFPRAKMFVVNLKHIVEKNLMEALEDKVAKTNLLGACWMDMIWAIGHEIDHSAYWYGCLKVLSDAEEKMARGEETDEYEAKELFAENTLKEEEDKANAAGDVAIAFIGQHHPTLIEPPPIEEFTFFGAGIQLALEDGLQKDEKWAHNHYALLKDGIMYSDENVDIRVLRDFANLGYAPKEEWDAPVIQAEPKTLAVGAQIGEPITGQIVEQLTQAPLPLETAGLAEVAEDNQVSMFDMLEEMAQNMETGSGEFIDVGEGATHQPEVADQPLQSFEQAEAIVIHAPLDLDPAMSVIDQAGINIYKRLYDHIFGAVWRASGSFISKDELFRSIHIKDLEVPGLKVMAYVTDMAGRFQTIPSNGEIVGRTFKDGTLPGYDLIFQLDNGVIAKRRWLVQNPWTSSKSSCRAGAGERIMWAINSAVDGDWKGSIQNGTWVPQRKQ